MTRLTHLRMLLFLIIIICGPCAHAANAGPTQPPEQDPSLTESVLSTVEDAWHRTKEAAPAAWGTLKEKSSQAWTDTKDKASAAWQTSQQYLPPNPKAEEARLWQETKPRLEEALSLQEQQEGLPKASWIGNNQQKNQEHINQLLDQIVEVLAVSNIPHFREHVAELHQKIATAKEDILAYREQRDIAPQTALVTKTAGDYERLIQEKEADITRYQQQILDVQLHYAKELTALGLDLDEQTVDLLSKNSHITGDVYVDLSLIFHQVNILLTKIEKLVNETREDLHHAKRYYGLYVILLKTLYYAQEEVERQLQDQYIAGIDVIIDELNRMVEDTKNQMRQFPDRRAQFATLIEQQQFSVKVAQAYRDELVFYRSEINQGKSELNQDIALAWQTYKTVRVVSELSNVINDSQALLEKLGDLQVPKFRPFENVQIEKEYEQITQRLRQREKR